MVSYLFQIKEVYFFGNLQNKLNKYKQVLYGINLNLAILVYCRKEHYG